MSHSAHGSFGAYYVAGPSTYAWLLPSAAEMVSLDNKAIAKGISALSLMETAGQAIADLILRLFPELENFLILCGSGNNGGDGLVIARRLRERGKRVNLILVAAARYSAECSEQVKLFGRVQMLADGSGEMFSAAEAITEIDFYEAVKRSELVVDALLGTGQVEAPRHDVARILRLLDHALQVEGRPKVLAVDVPTGINCDNGGVFNPLIRADLTVAVQFIKRGMLMFPARRVCGDIYVVPIGIDGDPTIEFSLIEAKNAPRLVSRALDTHKGELGRVLIIGGSMRMPGAAMLSALAALRAGAGIVGRIARRSWTFTPPLPEALFEVIEGSEDTFTVSDVPSVAAIISRYDSLIIGPGIGGDASVGDFVTGIIDCLKGSSIPVVIDADALNHIAARKISLRGLKAIITPHPGEAGRILERTTTLIQSDRFSTARDLARTVGAISVLKGAGSIIHDGKSGRLIADGTPYMATPGSGDVLSGIIGGCCLRSRSLMDAAVLGVWLHARAGVSAADAQQGPILASEIANALGPFVQSVE